MFQNANDPVALAVDLVNTWDELEPDPELLRDPAALKRFLARHGYESPRLGSRDLAQARALRDALRAAFTARDDEAAVRELNGVLAGSEAKPQFERMHHRIQGGARRTAFDPLRTLRRSTPRDPMRGDRPVPGIGP